MYRIALKTFSAAESRVVLGNAGAYNLPPTPGAGYLKTDAGDALRFGSFYVSQPNGGEGANQSAALSFVPAVPQVVPFTAAYTQPSPIALDAETEREPEDALPTESDWELLNGGLTGLGTKAHSVWLPPLEPRIGLDRFGGTEIVSGAVGHGVVSAIPWAVLDLPFQQRQSVLELDLSTPASSALVVGAPRSGKSYALFTLALSASLRLRPRQLQIYGLDFGGGVLSGLDDLPHTAGIARKGESDKQRRILSTVESEMSRREELFRIQGTTSVCAAWEAESAVDRDSFAEILVLVDGWSAARSDIADLDERIGSIAFQGLSLGIHVIVSTSRWMDVRPAVRDALATRLELRIVDPAESMFGRRSAHVIPPECPGRGMAGTGQLIQILAPDFATGVHDDTDDARKYDRAATVREIASAWAIAAPSERAPRVRLLPEALPFADLGGLLASARTRTSAAESLPLPVGIEENKLAPAYLDLAATPLALVFGNSGCGKSTLLKVIATAASATSPATDVRILLVDYRRKLRDVVPAGYRAGIACTEEEIVPMIEQLTSVLKERLANIASSPSPLPRIIVLVDDVDLVVGQAANPLVPLVPLLAHAEEIGLSLVLTRRVSGAARSAFDPVMQRMKDLGAAGIVMDGVKDEGKLVGDLIARPLPPGRAQFFTRDSGTTMWQLAYV